MMKFFVALYVLVVLQWLGATVVAQPDSRLLGEEEVVDMIRKVIEPLHTVYKNGVMLPPYTEIDSNGRAYISRPDAFDPSKLDPSKLATKTGMSASCSNQLCSFFEYGLSCKAIGIGMSKICAQYFMGRVLGCSIFPSPADFYNAPSVCINQLISVASLLAGGISPNSGFIGNFLNSNFTTNCHRNCYQNFLNAGNSFYASCSAELDVKPENTTYPIALALQNFNTIRQQFCAFNQTGGNCFKGLYSLTTSPPPINPFNNQPINLFDPTCNFLGLGDAGLPFIGAVLGGICTKFTGFGCCFANQMIMLTQDQTNASNIKFFPPCVRNYLTHSCPAISTTSPCTHGVGGNTTFISGYLNMSNFNNTKPMPNMYNQLSTLTLMGTILGAMQACGLNNNQLLALGINFKKPFVTQITGYTYYNDQGVPIVGQNGVPASVTGADYAAAKSAKFDFTLAIMGLSEKQTQQVYNALTCPFYSFGVQIGYSIGNFLPNVVVKIDTPPLHYMADPIITTKNSAISRFGSVWQLSMVCALLVTALSLIV